MRRLFAAGVAASMTMTMALIPSPARADYQTLVKDKHKDVTVVTAKVPGNQDIDIFKTYYAYNTSSHPSGNKQLAIEFQLRKLDETRSTTQLYVTEFKTGHQRYQVHANSKGAHAIYVWSGHAGAWLSYDSSCEVVTAVHPGASYIGGDITIYLNFCFPTRKVKILWSQSRNYDGLDMTAYDQVAVRTRIGS